MKFFYVSLYFVIIFRYDLYFDIGLKNLKMMIKPKSVVGINNTYNSLDYVFLIYSILFICYFV